MYPLSGRLMQCVGVVVTKKCNGSEHVCYKETPCLGRHKKVGTTAKLPKAPTHTINVSPPMQTNNATRATNGNFPARPLHMHLTNTPHTSQRTPSRRTFCSGSRSLSLARVQRTFDQVIAWNETIGPEHRKGKTVKFPCL